ncbi:hypothetical protein, partial [Salmonella enterica]|uniref:hypothetical protein n=1 Tax=Salmonella enterica TaxID=28901 RepID=UPI0020C2A59A
NNQTEPNFTLTLPYRPAAKGAAATALVTPTTGSATPPSMASFSSSKNATSQEFLLVDDNPINLKVRYLLAGSVGTTLTITDSVCE